MKILSWTLGLVAGCFLAVANPASAATLTGTGLDYTVDTDLGFGTVTGSVSDGVDPFLFEVIAFFDPLDPTNGPFGNLFITDVNSDPYLDGFLSEIEVGVDYVALLFFDLTGNGAAMFGSMARVVFTDFDWNSAVGTTSVSVSPIPLPATALLLFSGVAGVMVVGRRRKAA